MWNYFNYFCVPNDSQEMEFIQSYVFNTHRSPSDVCEFVFDLPFGSSDEYLKLVLYEFKKIVSLLSSTKTLYGKALTILNTLQHLEDQPYYSVDQARIMKLLGQEIFISGRLSEDLDSHFAFGNSLFTTLKNQQERSLGSPRLRLFANEFSSIFKVLIESDNRNLINSELFEELLVSAKSIGVQVNMDVLEYIFQQVNVLNKEQESKEESKESKEEEKEKQFYQFDEKFIIDSDCKMIQISYSNDSHSNNDEYNEYYHFLNLYSKSLLHLLTFVHFSGLPGLLSSTSPYTVYFGETKTLVKDLKFLVDKIIAAAENKDPKSVVEKCSVNVKRFVELQQCRKQSQSKQNEGEEKKSEKRMNRYNNQVVVNVDSIMEDGTGMIEMTRKVINSINIFSINWCQDDEMTAMTKYNVVSKNTRDFVFAFYHCDATKFLSSYMPTNPGKKRFNTESFFVATKMGKKPFLYTIEEKKKSETQEEKSTNFVAMVNYNNTLNDFNKFYTPASNSYYNTIKYIPSSYELKNVSR